MDTISLLTKKQAKFFDYLKKYIEGEGHAPTVQEMAEAMQLSSPRSITQYLEALERRGLIVRARYEKRGIRLRDLSEAHAPQTVTVPVIASAGCDEMSIFAERSFDEYICVASDMLVGRNKENIVSIKAIGDSMDEAGVNDGDYVLAEITENINPGDLVIAIIDGMAVIKKIEYANNAVILQPVSSNTKYRPIILNRDFKIFGKVVDVIRMPQKGDIEIVPLYQGEEMD